MSAPDYVAKAKLADLPPESTLAIDVDGVAALLCHHDDEIFAIENRCSHLQEPLACGRMRNGWIACPVHGARFDLETGEAITGPATTPVRTFAVRISGEMIEVAS